MTKQDIIKNVAKELKIPPKEAKPIVEGVLGHIRKSLESGIGLEISGFGKFTIRKKNQRIGRNPMTGEEAEITARKVVTFKSSKLFREAVNHASQ